MRAKVADFTTEGEGSSKQKRQEKMQQQIVVKLLSHLEPLEESKIDVAPPRHPVRILDPSCI